MSDFGIFAVSTYRIAGEDIGFLHKTEGGARSRGFFRRKGRVDNRNRLGSFLNVVVLAAEREV